MEKITWRQEKRKLSDLKPYGENPRTISKSNFNALVKNIKESGYTNRLIVNTDNTVLGGNQRLKALKELGYKEIDVLVPEIELTKEQEERINVTDNLSAGAWDFDILGNSFDAEKLIEWGMPPEWLGQSHFDVSEDSDEKIKETKVKTCPHCGEILN